MKKILNIVLGEISTGELSIAILFAKGLDRALYQSHFLIPEDKKSIINKDSDFNIFTLSNNNKPQYNQAIIRGIIEEEKYDLIILFDVFTFEYAQSWSGMNLNIIRGFNIPIMSLDEYEYTKAGYKLDYYGMFIKRLPPLLDKCDYVIKNCPLSMQDKTDININDNNDRKEYYYRIFDNIDRISQEEKLYIKTRYIPNLGENKKIVFFTTSRWEVQGAYSFSSQNRLVAWLGVILHEYLKELDEEIVLVHIGEEKWKIPKKESKVEYIHYDSLPVNEFEELLQSVDLYITFNIVSITLSKAIMFGIPSLILNNSNIIEFSRLENRLKMRPQWYQEMAKDVKKIYPFAASMFGWSNFLKTVLNNNSYVETFKRVDMFNYNKTKELLKNILIDEKLREEVIENNEKFIEEYMKINSSNDIINNIFSNDYN